MNASQYMKNVGKSLGYIAIDSFKSMNPAVAAVYDNAKEFTQDLYQTINDFKGKAIGSDGDSIVNKAKSTANDTWKNARDDFLSGKWYNKERKSAASDEALKAMGFDFDFDFDLDDAFEEGPTNSANVEEMEQSAKETAAVMGTIEGSVASAANSMVSATVQSTEYLASLQNANSSAIYSLNAQGFNNVTLGLNAINANLSTALSLAEPLTAHMQNSATFYAKSTEFQNKTINLLEQLVKNTTPAQPKKGSKGPKFEDYVNSGGIDFARLFADAKESVAKEVKGYKEMLDMLGGGKGLISDFTSSPISALISSLIIPALVPKGTKKRMKSINDYMEVLGFNALQKYGQKFNDSPLGFVLDFLGFSIPTIKNKTNLRTDRYEKGKVDWNGKAQKALMEVIPYYLSKMTAIMDGSGEMEIFDYDKGKFTTRKKIREAFDKGRRDTARSYSYDFYGKIEKSTFTHKDQITREDVSELTEMLMLYGGAEYYLLFSPNRNERENYLRGHKKIRDYLQRKPYLKLYVDKISRAGGNEYGVQKYDLGKYSMNIGQAQAAYTNRLTAAEESGQFDILFNDSSEAKTKAGLFGGVDKNGYSALDYLRGIYINTSGGGVGGGKRGRVDVGNLHKDIGNPNRRNNRSRRSAAATGTNTSQTIDEKAIIDSLKSQYGKAWDSFDGKLKDYLIKKKDYERRGLEDEFEEDDAIEMEIKTKKFTSSIANFGKELGIGEHVGGLLNKMADILKTPTDIVNRALDAIKSSVHDIIFSEKGLMGWLFDKEHGKLRPALNSIKNKLTSVFLGNEVPDDAIAQTAPITAYNGRVIRRTGMAAVSEGEIIIPAEFNPYYSKPIDKAKQIANENRAISRFYGAFANGTDDVGGDGGNKKKRREGGLVGAASNILQKGFLDFGQLLFQTFSRSVGIGDEKKEKSDKKKIEGVVKDALEGIKEHGGDAAVGALIGGGVSLLTGAVISPILGASLGAASGLLLSSDKVRTFLFGDGVDPEKGLIKGEAGKKIRNFIESQLPDTLAGGAIGGIGGALLGHPVLGMFLGSGIGFAARSTEVQDFLFGKKNAEGGRDDNGVIPKVLQDKFKKALPGASAGAIAGLVASAFGGPFGLFGNMILGAGIGTVVTSEKFKNWFLGEEDENGKRKGGFVQELRDRVLDPARDMILNIGDKIRQDFRTVALNFSAMLTNFVKKLSVPITAIGRGARKGLDTVSEKLGLPKLPKKILPNLKGLSDKVRGSNLKRGYLSFKDGKALTAAERLAEMQTLGIDDGFGYSISKMLAGSQRKDGSYRGLNLKQQTRLEATIKQLEKETDPERRAEIISSNNLLKQLNMSDLSGANLRKLKDAFRLEKGKNTTENIVADIGDDVTKIFNMIKSIRDNGIKINNYPSKKKGSGNVTKSENDASTNAGQLKRKIEEAQQKEQDEINNNLDRMADANERIKEGLLGQNTSDKSTGNDKDKEAKKEGLLGKISKLFDKDSAIGKAAESITKLTGIVTAAVVGIALVLGSGVFDNIFNKLGIGFGIGDNISFINNKTGKEQGRINNIFTTLFKKNPFGEGNYEDLSASINDTASMSDRALSGLLRNAPRILSKMHGSAARAFEVVVTQTYTFCKALGKVGFIANAFKAFGSSKLGKPLAEFAEGLIDAADNILLGAGSGTLKSILDTAAVFITIVSVITDFTAGMQDAETTLKVLDPTIPERVICGIVRAVKNDIPWVGIVGSMIPDSLIFDIAMATIGKALGLKGLEQRRAEAQKKLDEFNKEHNTDFSWSQYVKSEEGLNKKTWTETAWEGVKTGFTRTVEAFKNPKQYAENIKKGLTEGWDSGNTLAGKLFGATYGAIDNALPGVLGDFTATNGRLWQHAFDGDIQKLWAENFESFRDTKDPISIIMSNIPLFQNKLVLTPIAAALMGFRAIRDGFEDINLGDGLFNSIASDTYNIFGHAIAGDMKELWDYKTLSRNYLAKDNEFTGKILDSTLMIQKIMWTPIAAVTWSIKQYLHYINNPLGFIDYTKALIHDRSEPEKMGKYVAEGDIKGLLSVEPTETNSKLGQPMAEMMNAINKIIFLPVAITIHDIKFWQSKIDPLISGFKDGFDYLKEQNEIGIEWIWNSDATISDLLTIPDPKENVPMPGLFKIGAFGSRLIGVTSQVIFGTFEAIASYVETDIIPEFKITGEDINNNFNKVMNAFEEGDILGLSRMKPSVRSQTALGKMITTGTFTVSKLVAVIPTSITTITRLLVDGVVEEVNNGITVVGDLKTDVNSMWESAKKGDLLGVINAESTASINASGDHPVWGTVADLGFYLSKGILIGHAAVLDVLGITGGFIVKTSQSIATIFSTCKEQIKVGEAIFMENSGASFDTFYSNITADITETDDPIKKLANGLVITSRLIGAPIAMINIIGSTIGSHLQSYYDTLKQGVQGVIDDTKLGISIGEKGVTDELKLTVFNSLEDIDNANGIDAVFKGISTIPLFVGMGVGLIKRVGMSFKEFITPTIDKVKADADLYSTYSLDMIDILSDDEKSFNDILNMEDNFNSPISGIFKAELFIGKIFYGTIKLLTDFIKNIDLSDILNNTFGSLGEGLKDIGTFRRDKNEGKRSFFGGGGSSGFISQNDPRYSNQGLGNYNVGEMGCGPAAASMVLGNNMSSNINLARKYQTAGGTDLAYFADAFARNGKSAKYYNLAAGASGADMVSDIASGKPVVLMGRDPYNTSKRYSPFGPNNHYVVARGFKNGGVVIDDPEMSAGGRIYSTNILRNVTAAVGAGRSGLTGIGAGGAMVDNEVARQIWAYFKQQGYTDGAVAGMLGNIQAESSFRLTAVGDNGTSYGICQWHNSRWTKLKNYAASVGKDQSDLDAQLGYLKSELDAGGAGAGYSSIEDPTKAADQFCRKFEVPDDVDKKVPGRQQTAVEFYNAYSGKTFTYSGSNSSSSSSSTSFSKSKKKPKTKLQKMLGFASTIGNIFGKALFGYGDDEDDTEITASGTNSSGASIYNNNIPVTTWPGKQPVEYMRDMIGKLQYSTKNRDPEKGGGDCSSTVAWALTKAGLPVTSDSRWQYMNNTNPYTHPSWQQVMWYDGGKPLGQRALDVDLKPNDVIFYSHGGSSYPDHVDHVEMYNGNGEVIGNGGGVGTRTRPFSAMQDQIIKVVRPKGEWDQAASGSGLLSGIDIKKSPSTIRTTEGKIYNLNEYRQIRRSGGASALNNNGGVDKNTALILRSMIALIESIVKNTNDISSIYQVISAYCSSNPNTKTAEALSKIAENNSDNSDVELALADLKATVNNILAS